MIDLLTQHMNRVLDGVERRQRILTAHINPPIPVRQFDWAAWLDGDEEAGPTGTGATEADAIRDLQQQIEEK